MNQTNEVEFICHLENGIDPLTALAALPVEPAADPIHEPSRPAFQAGLLIGVLAVLAAVLWAF